MHTNLTRYLHPILTHQSDLRSYQIGFSCARSVSLKNANKRSKWVKFECNLTANWKSLAKLPDSNKKGLRDFRSGSDSIFLPLFPFMRNSPSYFRAPVQERYGGLLHLDLQVIDFHGFAADNQPPRDRPVTAGVNIA